MCKFLYFCSKVCGHCVKKLLKCLWIWKIQLPISIRKVLGMKRALNKAFKILGISMSFLPLSYNPLFVGSWFFQPWSALGKMTIIIYLSTTTWMACRRYRECYKDIFPCSGKSKKRSFVQHVRVIFLVLVVERVTAYDTLNLNRTWIRKFLLSQCIKIWSDKTDVYWFI